MNRGTVVPTRGPARGPLPPSASIISVAATAGLVLAVIGLVAWLAMFVQGWKSVPVDKVALHYTGGPIQGEQFEEVVSPGTPTRFYGLLENIYELPATQRNYIMSKHPDDGERRAEHVGAPAADKVVIDVESGVYFRLNTRPATVRVFFEQICLKYDCTDLSPGGGWDRMLADTLRQQIVAAIQEETRQYNSEELYADRDVLLRMQSAVGSTLKRRVNEVLGGEFFCGPTFRPEGQDCPEFAFVIKELSVPPNVQEQYNANRAAALSVETARSEAEKQAVLGAAPALTAAQLAYIRAQAELECARRPDCVLVIGGDATAVEIGPRMTRP